MKVELTKSTGQFTDDEFTVTLKRYQLEQLHLILLNARRDGKQELSRAITAAMTGQVSPE
jgi:hypothetical protein